MNKNRILGIDIGGSHISAALVTAGEGRVLRESFHKEKIDSDRSGSGVLDQWLGAIRTTLNGIPLETLGGIGIAMPGPFDYSRGISLIDGVNKYRDLYGINVREALKSRLGSGPDMPIVFENDAACFGLGESFTPAVGGKSRLITITLGTGFGASFIKDHQVLKQGKGVPPDGLLYNIPFKDGIAEDYISSRWLLNSYNQRSAEKAVDVKEMADRALLKADREALSLFETLGGHIAACLVPWLRAFEADALVLGGSISQASKLFLPALSAALEKATIPCQLILSGNMELSAIAGAAHLIRMETIKDKSANVWRKTSQPLLPLEMPAAKDRNGAYDLYPYRRLGDGQIFRGYESLAEMIATQKSIVIDGFIGNDWAEIRDRLSPYLKHLRVLWYESAAFEKQAADIDQLVTPWLGGPGSVWGKKTELSLANFFRADKLKSIAIDQDHDLTIFIGTGAALCHPSAPVVYIDLPKNELQYRMRAGTCTNLGVNAPGIPTEMYKRFYFVDWVVLSRHRQDIKDRITVLADGQWKDDITWVKTIALNKGLEQAAHNVLRVRPWFEAGAWGGQWMKQHILRLPQEEINYAWSFELIVPENGLVFESDGHLLELSFDWLMEHNALAVLGKDAVRFGTEFPIRFDFLDTFDGGNLSIQCHPRLAYIREHFGERITQDETYYILDCKGDAGVYLGFQETIEPVAFRTLLEESVADNIPVDITEHVQYHPARRHELFLIPNGTVHSAGANNLVLEISATPYIFTFKMYDWLRLDLNGEPRPINIEHAFNNLDFSRKGDKVKQELLAHPVVIDKGVDYQLVHLPTHPEHFYDVHRIEFLHEVTVDTRGQCHVLMLVEGNSIVVVTKNGESHRFNYAETFVIPAAAENYRLINEGGETVKVIKAFVK